ncbi:MAG: hypothetical protein WBL45_09775 [Solirubrobacterales bacterium]
MDFPFTPKTIGTLVESIAMGYSHAGIGTLLLKAGADDWAPEQWDNKEHRMQLVFKSLRAAEDPDAATAALELARLALEAGAPASAGATTRIIWWEPLRDALAADGWEYDIESARLTSVVPGVVVPEHLSGLEEELEERGWTTAAGHFRQAVEGFGAGNWATTNSQLRSFLEDMLPLAAEATDGQRPSSARAALDLLKKEVLLDGEFDFLKGLWTLCQSRGSHPGLSDRAEATFRLMVVTAEAHHLLGRLN